MSVIDDLVHAYAAAFEIPSDLLIGKAPGGMETPTRELEVFGRVIRREQREFVREEIGIMRGEIDEQ